MFYLDGNLPNISPSFLQGKLFANIFPHPIITLYSIKNDSVFPKKICAK